MFAYFSSFLAEIKNVNDNIWFVVHVLILIFIWLEWFRFRDFNIDSCITFFLQDGKGNRVKQWNRALTTKGVFAGELQLSEYPVMGDWRIVITLFDQVFTKTFQVAEYVLPKFEVLIEAPKHATFKDSSVVAKIRAK